MLGLCLATGCPQPTSPNDHTPVEDVAPGEIGTLVGTGTPGFSGDGGRALAATLNSPMDLALVGGAALLIADFDNHRVRRADLVTGLLTTVAGDGQRIGPESLDSPSGVHALPDGGFLVTAWGAGRVFRYGTSGGRLLEFGTGDDSCAESTPTTVAGETATSRPRNVDVMADGSLLVAEQGCHRVRRLAAGTVATYAGSGSAGYSGDGGDAEQASLHAGGAGDGPSFGISLSPEDPPDELFIADTENHVIRLVRVFTGRMETFAGSGEPGFADGAPGEARFNRPTHVFSGLDHSLWIVDSGNHAIRYIDPLRTQVTTIAGTGVPGYNGDGIRAVDAQFNNPAGVVVSAGNRVYVADSGNHRVRVINVSPAE